MPKYELPKFSTEELLAAFGSRVSPAGVIKAGTEGLKFGADLASTIAETKGKKLKQQQEIAEIERKLAAQELLAKTVEGKPEIQKARTQVNQFAQQPLTTKPITQVGGKDIIPTRAQTLEGAEQISSATEQINTKDLEGRTMGAVMRALPIEESMKLLHPEKQKENIQQSAITYQGKTIPVMVDLNNKKTFYLTGEEVPAEILQQSTRGYRAEVRTNPVTGMREVYDPNTLSWLPTESGKLPAQSIGSLPVNIAAQFDKEVGKYQADPVIEASRLSKSQLSSLRSVLDTGVGFATEPLKSLIARVIAGEKGVLTEKDVARNSGNQAIVPKLQQLLTKWQSGQFTEQNKVELKTIIDAIEKNADVRFERTTQNFADRLAKRFRVDPQEANDYIRLNVDFEPTVEEAPAPKANDIGAALRAILPKVK